MHGTTMAAREASLGYLNRLPKVELHLHLEGAIPLGALWQLMCKYGGDPEVPSEEALACRFQYRDFPHFLRTWSWKNQFLREYEDFTLIAAEVARDLASKNVLYAEMFYSPGDFQTRGDFRVPGDSLRPGDPRRTGDSRRQGLEPQRLTEAIRAGLRQVPRVGIALIVDLIRDLGPERGERILDAVAELRGDLGVIGVGIGGSEHRFPPAPYARVYEKARELGLRTTAHAGEAAGPESIWGAIRCLHADRIGHGTRAIEDQALVEHIARHRIPIELCPISNVRTGVVRSIAEHPARSYFEAGIPLSVNTDDPRLFTTSLAEEYLALQQGLGFTVPEIHALIHQAIDCSWLSQPDKRELHGRVKASIEAILSSGGTP